MIQRHLKIVLWHHLLALSYVKVPQTEFWLLEVWKQRSFICGSHSSKWLQIQHKNCDVYFSYTFYAILRKILKLQSEYFLAHLVMTIYINYHFVWVTKWNLNIIKEHITFKQHLWNIVTELLHWELCTHIKEYWGFSNPFFWKGFQSFLM